MRMTYSAPADALAIERAAGAKSAETRELATDVYADYDLNGRLIGLEVLGASRFYDRAELERLASPVEYLDPG